MIATVVGSYPRPKWFREYLKRIEGLQKDLDAEVDVENLKKAISEVIEKQREAGIDLMTDGQLIWHDFLATLATRIDGFVMDGLVRYFDNNLYYRKPIVKDRLRRKGDILWDFKLALEIERNVKPVLSCFTLAKLSKNEYYSNFEELLWDLGEIVKEEIRDLNVEFIQFDEPALLFASKGEIEIARDVFKEICKVNARTILMTYFRSAENIFPEVLDFGFDIIGLDFVEGFEANLKLAKEYGLEMINVGIVDARNTRMEDLNDLKAKLEKILEFAKEVYISPNTGLEFLPEVKAFEKMKLVSKLKEAFE